MKTNNISNTSFKGSFVINSKNSRIKEAIPQIIKRGRQLFYDIKQDGDVVIVTKDKYDKRVAEFIDSNNLEFEYYPEISTSSGLDDQIPSVLKNMLKIKNNCVIKDLGLLNKFFKNSKLHLSTQSKYLQDTVDTLRLNIENSKVEIDSKGRFLIRDAVKERTVVSAGFNSGTSYVYVIPDSLNQDTKRFLIGKNGKEIIKEFSTPKEMSAFNKAFKKAAASLIDEK